MEQDFYKSKLIKNRLNVIIPDGDDRALINKTIYDELCKGIINQDSKKQFQLIIEKLAKQGAQAVILGCTEIGLLIKPQDSVLPTFDTAEIHAKQAALHSIE